LLRREGGGSVGADAGDGWRRLVECCVVTGDLMGEAEAGTNGTRAFASSPVHHSKSSKTPTIMCNQGV
jgi:hypothetical protein